MKRRGYQLSDAAYAYVLEHTLRKPAGLDVLMEETAQLKNSGMMSPPEQGQFLAFLVRAIGARTAIEVGVFTGATTLWLAEAVGPDGTVVACDRSEEFTAIGRRHWETAGVADRIDLRLGAASETLQALLEEGKAGTFDFMYIDADKTGYDGYYEQGLSLLRPGGLIAFDNMLQGGRIADPDAAGESVESVRALIAKLHADERADVSLLPMADGVYLVRKR